MRSIDPDKLKDKRAREMVASVMTDMADHISVIENALATASDTDEHADDREGAREEGAQALDELLAEFEALQRICMERLT